MAKFNFPTGATINGRTSGPGSCTWKRPARPSKQRWHLLVPLAALGTVLWLLFSPHVHRDQMTWASSWLTSTTDVLSTSKTRQFRWNNIIPSQTLEYSPCFDSYQCARLSVPLNWNATTIEQDNGPRVAIAIIKLPAKIPVTDSRYGGPVILNPGGPGESGINQVLTDGKNIQTIIDDPLTPTNENANSTSEKYFDIISFDPRGVNNTTPGLRCFPNAFNQHSWLLTYTDYGLLWDSESIVGMEWARAAALGASCSQERHGEEILRYANTPQVVEDVVELIEKEGEWRAREAQTLMSANGRINSTIAAAILERTAYQPGREKLQYWGMSFGTVIGSTFAAMHPDRVGRVVIDGVVDPADHYAGAWLTQLQNSDAVVTELCRACFEAGPKNCTLFTGSSAADVEDRFTRAMMSLKASPLPVVLPSTNTSIGGTLLGPDIITYGDVHLYLLSGMYFPFAMAEELFNLVHALESRNTTLPKLANLVALKQAKLVPDDCEQSGPLSDQCIPYVSMMGSFQSISCMDGGGGPTNLTRDKFHDYLVKLRAQSQWVSPSWARNKLVCLGHDFPPAWRPDLDFVNRQLQNTSHSLLIIGNTHDPVTPIGNAHRISTLFPGSVVLRQDSEGHCSHSNPSLCTAKVVREYFQTGELPREGTVCEPDFRPFVGCSRNDSCHLEDVEDKKLLEAMVELADPFGLTKKMGIMHKARALQKLMFIP
jgi:pimeloyl-ACP methyl ester carboxylesterase